MPVGNLAVVWGVKTNQLLTTVRGSTFWENAWSRAHVMVCLTMPAGPKDELRMFKSRTLKMTPPRTHLWAINIIIYPPFHHS